MSAAVIFSGPTLPPSEVRTLCPTAVVRGPAACGDVLRAARERPAAIAVIDGVFDQRLAVWHKEILWALAQGIPVYGAGSMGALRAAELARFGMVGVGRVFQWFADGVLEDDDEVALVHDASEHGYAPRSEALVNIRSTLEAAVTAGVLTSAGCQSFIIIAKKQFYPDRSFPSLLAAARAQGVDDGQRRALATWLTGGHRIDQKRLDALQLIDRLNSESELLGRAVPATPKSFVFEHTDAWENLLCQLEREDAEGAAPDLGTQLA